MRKIIGLMGVLEYSKSSGDTYLNGLQEGVLRYGLQKVKAVSNNLGAPDIGKNHDKERIR